MRGRDAEHGASVRKVAHHARLRTDSGWLPSFKCPAIPDCEATAQYLINTARAAARQANITMPIFTHGYDYPWPDWSRGYFLSWLEDRAVVR